MSRNSSKLIDDKILEDWLTDMLENNHHFLEPVLDDHMSAVLYKTCMTLHQDQHVFVMAVDILEMYFHAKLLKNEEIESTVLMMATAIFAASKLAGVEPNLKLHHLKNVLVKLTGVEWTTQKLLQAEIEMYKTLDCKLPNFSFLDDVNMIMEVFMKKWHLKADLHPLGIELAAYLYLSRMEWYEKLKEIYNQNEDALGVFQMLTSSRIYLPIGVLISSLYLCGYANMLDFNSLISELALSLNIHTDHLNVLVNQIVQVYNAHSA